MESQQEPQQKKQNLTLFLSGLQPEAVEEEVKAFFQPTAI